MPNQKKWRASAYDVARLAGVSQSTVSRVFAPGFLSLSEAARMKVFAAARELDYQPNLLARSLTTRRTNIVGVLVSDLGNPLYHELLDRLWSELQAHDLQALVFSAPKGQPLDEVMPRLLRYQVDAAIALTATVSSRIPAECERAGLPLVLLNRTVHDQSVNSVTADNRGGGRLVGEYLLSRGFRRIAYLTGHFDTSTSLDREEGFRECVAAHAGIAVERLSGGYSYEGSLSAARALLARPVRPDAVFCLNDHMAMGVMDVARHEFGLRVPEDMAVIGFDDIPAASRLTYALTTIRLDLPTMASNVVSMIGTLLADRSQPALRVTVPCSLVVRRSA